jgi:biopolymer transport protein ExbB/TolQ
MPDIHHRITPVDVFADAEPLAKLVVIVLLAAMLAALVVLAAKLAGGKRLNGGSAFLSGLRFGGPIIGGLGACSSLLMMTLGVANAPVEVTLKMMAPGFAEAFLQVGLGFLAGAVAVFGHWAVESRIDRQVLGV